MDHQHYAEAYSDAATWLQTNKESLCVSTDITGDRSKIQTQLEKLQVLVCVIIVLYKIFKSCCDMK